MCEDRAEAGRERFTEKLKEQDWYNVKCPKCKISNRNWLENEEDVYKYPIKYVKEEFDEIKGVKNIEFYEKIKFSGHWIYLVYHCRMCGEYFA